MEEAALWKIAVWILTLVLGASLAKTFRDGLDAVKAATAWLFYTFIAFYSFFLLKAFQAPLMALFALFLFLYYAPVLFYFEKLEEIYRLEQQYYWRAIFWLLVAVAASRYLPEYYLLCNLVIGFLAAWLGGEGIGESRNA